MLDHPSNSNSFPFPDLILHKVVQAGGFLSVSFPTSLRAAGVNTCGFVAILERTFSSWKRVIEKKGGEGKSMSNIGIKNWLAICQEENKGTMDMKDWILVCKCLWQENSNAVGEA